jgi:hypothetical protein
VVPPRSDRISRVPPYSRIIVRITRTGLSPTMARLSRRFRLSHNYHWPGPRSLATTCGVSVDVLSYGYLDVSVPRVRHLTLCIQIKLPDFDTWKSVWLSLTGRTGCQSNLALRGADLKVRRPVGLAILRIEDTSFAHSNKTDFPSISGGFPHSEIVGSKGIRTSPTLIAAYHVLHRLCMPRHPPIALNSLDHSHCQYPSFRPPVLSSRTEPDTQRQRIGLKKTSFSRSVRWRG